MNEGALRFGNLGKHDPELGRLLHVTKMTTGLWRRGIKLPSDAARKRIEELFGIHRGLWDKAPAVVAPVQPATERVTPVVEASGLSSAEQQVLASLRRLECQRDEADLSSSSRLKIESQIVRNLGLLAKFRGEGSQVSEKTILAHPAWTRLIGLVYETIANSTSSGHKMVGEVVEALRAHAE